MRRWTVTLTMAALFAVMASTVWAQPQRRGQMPGGPPGMPEGGQFQPPGGGFDPFRMNPLMMALDTNGDGELSADEIANAPQALKKLDKNGDGKVTRDELRPQFGDRGGPGGRGPGGPGGPAGRGPDAGVPGERAPDGPQGFQGRGRGGPGGPMGPGPGEPDAARGRQAGGRGNAGSSRGGQPASFDTATQPRDDAERKIVETISDIMREQGRRLNVPTADGRLLRLLAESIGAKSVVEFGTSNGISSIWMSLALHKTGGKITTHEIDPDTAALARKNFERAGIADIVTVVEGDAHEKAADLKGPIDLVFIDADKEGYLDYFKKTLPLVRPGGLILAHNMNPRMADPEFVKVITTSPDVETLFYLEGGGMSVSMKKR